MEYFMEAQRNGCANVSIGCNAMSTTPQQLDLRAGWVEKTGKKKEGYCGDLVFNDHKLVWNKEHWLLTNQKTGVSEQHKAGMTITIPALAHGDAAFSRPVFFGQGARLS